MVRVFSYWVPLKALINGALAVALSFIAYSKRIKANNVSSFNGYCDYPSSSAWYYGLIATLAILVEQITISVGMRCFCCNRGLRFPKKFAAILSMIFFILSWLSFVITFIGLIYTTVVNNHKFLVKHHSQNNGGSCFIGKENLFLGTAIWCVITTVLGLIAYTFWACSADYRNSGIQAGHGQGLAMGQPHTGHTQLPKEQC